MYIWIPSSSSARFDLFSSHQYVAPAAGLRIDNNPSGLQLPIPFRAFFFFFFHRAG